MVDEISPVDKEVLTGVTDVNQVIPGSPMVSGKDKISEKESERGNKISEKVSERGAGLEPRKKRFDWQKKRRFLRIARTYWPNITLCCAMAGIHPSSYYLHLKIDKVFWQKVKDIDQGTTDRIEGVMATEAINPKSFLDRMAYLRAHRPELYNPAKVVKIEGYQMGQGEAAKRLGALGDAVDAEIVKSYLDRKEQRERNAKINAERKSLASGENGGEGGVSGV